MIGSGPWVEVIVAGVAATALVMALWRLSESAPRRPLIPMHWFDGGPIDPEWAADRLIKAIERSKTHGEVVTGGIRCTARWVADIHASGYGYWVLQIGRQRETARDLSIVYGLTRARLQQARAAQRSAQP